MKNQNNRTTIQLFWKLLQLVKPLCLPMSIAVLTGVLGFLCASFITICGGYAVLTVLGASNVMSVQYLCGLLIVFAVFRGILHYIEHACNHYIAFKLLAHIRDKVFSVLRSLAPAKVETREKGKLIALVTGDIELLEIFFAHTISPICIAIMMLFIMVGFISTYSLYLGCIALLAYVVVGCIIPILASKWTEKLGEMQRNEFAELNSYYLDSLRGIEEIRQFHQGGARLKDISRMTECMEYTNKTLKAKTSVATGLTNSCVLGFSTCLFLGACLLYQTGKLDIEGVIIPTLTLFSSFGPFIALSNLGTGLAQTIASGNRIMNLLEETSAVMEKSDGVTTEIGSIVFDEVDFSYQNDVCEWEKIIDHMSFEIKEKKITGIIGKSGCGKSTILKLIMRFWDVNNGNISIDGNNIKDINTASLRENQSFITQETYLFKETIYENIRIAKLDATKEEVMAACKKAAIHDFIMGLPKGYDTQVGELGDTLSGGERQRIGLARAFLHNASCMLLDEPTSNLDSLNEAIILKSLKEDQDRTILIVTHRPSTMVIADQVIEVTREHI